MKMWNNNFHEDKTLKQTKKCFQLKIKQFKLFQFKLSQFGSWTVRECYLNVEKFWVALESSVWPYVTV